EMHDAGLERVAREQHEVQARPAIAEETKTRASCGRMDEQVQLVDEPCGEELPHDRNASADSDPVDAWVALQGANPVDEITLGVLRVAPAEIQTAARSHDLARIAKSFGELGVRATGGLASGPRAGKAVVRHASEQHDVGLVCLADGRAHLVVEV